MLPRPHHVQSAQICVLSAACGVGNCISQFAEAILLVCDKQTNATQSSRIAEPYQVRKWNGVMFYLFQPTEPVHSI